MESLDYNKIFGKRLSHTYLKNKLPDLWKPLESLTLKNLGCDYYIAFTIPTNLYKALLGGYGSCRKFSLGQKMEIKFHTKSGNTYSDGYLDKVTITFDGIL